MLLFNEMKFMCQFTTTYYTRAPDRYTNFVWSDKIRSTLMAYLHVLARLSHNRFSLNQHQHRWQVYSQTAADGGRSHLDFLYAGNRQEPLLYHGLQKMIIRIMSVNLFNTARNC